MFHVALSSLTKSLCLHVLTSTILYVHLVTLGVRIWLTPEHKQLPINWCQNLIDTRTQTAVRTWLTPEHKQLPINWFQNWLTPEHKQQSELGWHQNTTAGNSLISEFVDTRTQTAAILWHQTSRSSAGNLWLKKCLFPKCSTARSSRHLGKSFFH